MIQIVILTCIAAAGIVMVIVGIVKAVAVKERDIRAMTWLLLLASGIVLIAIVYVAISQIMGGLLHG